MDVTQENVRKFSTLTDDEQAAVLLRCSTPPTNEEMEAAFKWLAEHPQD